MPDHETAAGQSIQANEEQAALVSILRGTASETGQRFFAALAENLSIALHSQLAWVTEYLEAEESLHVLAFYSPGDAKLKEIYPLAGTPCEPVIKGATLIHLPDEASLAYPHDMALQRMDIRSYLGVPLVDLDGSVLGHLAVMDTQPMPAEPRFLAVLQIFAARATAELQRLRAEAAALEHATQVSQLVEGAMDAIVQVDADLKVVLLNPAAESLLSVTLADSLHKTFIGYLETASATKLRSLIGHLNEQNEINRSMWVPGELDIAGTRGTRIKAEATLSRFSSKSGDRYTLILRDVNQRIQAEQKIQSLTVQTRYLNEEIRTLSGFHEMIGSSPAMQQVFNDIEQVARTHATVLVVGETGTGKELIVRAVHSASFRAEMPLIKVNCGALPETLIESELFGHERGAFTGATHKREGRFSMADGGTLFLDEIGDLPIHLQVKLLRVLQEGEFEMLGSSVTRKVDVRVIAATNRNLVSAIENGEFREDLYYRLSVFPISLPPLRDRLEDIEPLASAFLERYSKQLGRPPAYFNAEQIEHLGAYAWPGNIRELQNVVERALITARSGLPNLDRALPETFAQPVTERIRTVADMEEAERSNFLGALERTDWQISGAGGAAEMLGINSSTLSSRLKSLGIRRPQGKE